MKRIPPLGMVVWITAVWVLLWGDLSLGNVVNGIIAAFGLWFVLPLPRVHRRYRIRPLAMVVLVAVFLKDVAVASWQVATLVCARRQPRSAVVRVELRSHNDLYLSAVAMLTTLVPGSVAVEALKFSGIIYAHVLDVDADNPRRSLDEFRASVLAQEERLLRAVASDAELIDAGYDPGWRCQGGDYIRADIAAESVRAEAVPAEGTP